jgi:hypothetical protein
VLAAADQIIEAGRKRPLVSLLRFLRVSPHRADRVGLSEWVLSLTWDRTAARVYRTRLDGVRGTLNFLMRTIRAVKLAATDKRIPRPLRLLAAVGLAPIPGPFDEALLLVIAIPLALFYRQPLADAWARAGA